MDPLVFGGPGGVEIRLGFDDEEKLLGVLLDRARDRIRAESTEPLDLAPDDLLAARVHAIHSGQVAVQNVRPKRTTEEKLQALRARSRALA